MACAARSAAEEGGASLPGSGTGRLELGRASPEQAEHDGEYAQPVEQAGAQFAHGETRSFPAEVCPKTGENSQFHTGMLYFVRQIVLYYR